MSCEPGVCLFRGCRRTSCAPIPRLISSLSDTTCARARAALSAALPASAVNVAQQQNVARDGCSCACDAGSLQNKQENEFMIGRKMRNTTARCRKIQVECSIHTKNPGTIKMLQSLANRPGHFLFWCWKPFKTHGKMKFCRKCSPA